MLILRSKVVIVGEAHVGKSAVTQMFLDGNFPKNYVMTIGVDFGMKMVNIPETNTAVELYLFDTAGQTIFSQIEQGEKYWENCSMVVVVYDVSNRKSFEMCAKWLHNVRATRPGRLIPGVLLANKMDLKETGRAVVDSQEGYSFAQQNQLEYFECSAQNGTDVDAPFNFIADTFYRKYEEAVDRSERISA